MRGLQLSIATSASPWIQVRDGNDTVRQMFDAHYSRRVYADGRQTKLFVGPGSKCVLVTPGADAFFIWRKFIDGSGQAGINCAAFRRDERCPAKASELILAAEPFAWAKWPCETRFYTYVNADRVRRKRDPGRCFMRAGWTPCGKTKGGLLILEKRR